MSEEAGRSPDGQRSYRQRVATCYVLVPMCDYAKTLRRQFRRAIIPKLRNSSSKRGKSGRYRHGVPFDSGDKP